MAERRDSASPISLSPDHATRQLAGAPADKVDWESLVEGLLRDLEEIRSMALKGESSAQPSERLEKT